jgi:ribosomal protein S10
VLRHGIPIAVVRLQSHAPELLVLFIHFVLRAAYPLNMPVSRAMCIPTKCSLYFIIRGPFPHNKSQANFEKVGHKRAIKIWDTHSETLRKWMKYLEINLGGVGMRIVRWEHPAIGFGRARVGHLEAERQLHAELADEEVGRI